MMKKMIYLGSLLFIFVVFSQVSGQSFTENSQNFSAIATETDFESFSINITFNSTQFTAITSRLLYNGVFTTGTRTGSGDDAILTSSFDIPLFTGFSSTETILGENQNTSQNSVLTMSGAAGRNRGGQTFTVGFNGFNGQFTPTAVVLNYTDNCNTGNDIRIVATNNGLPNESMIIASAEIPNQGFLRTRINFSTINADLFSGITYAIRGSCGDAGNAFSFNYQNTDVYGGGTLIHCTPFSNCVWSNFTDPTADMFFEILGNATVGNLTWEVSLTNLTGTFIENSTQQSQTIEELDFNLCNTDPQLNMPYINFTFANETAGQEALSASFLSSWTFFAGSGTITKSLTFNEASENPSYAFCTSPSDETITAEPTVTYDNDASQPRGYSPGELTLTNSTTSVTLFLLPTASGIFATIQVLTIAGNPISGARIVLSDSDFGNLESRTTADSGTATFFVDPFNVYTIQASATGFVTFSGTNMFATTEFTIILSGALANVTDPTAGITFTIIPTAAFLNNNTDFTFEFDINAALANLDTYGFFLSNGTDVLATSSIGNTPGGSTISLSFNTGNQTNIIMNSFYIVGTQEQNITRVWIVRDDNTLTQWSIRNFAVRLSKYLNEGIFGITNLGLALIVFIAIFMITGILSFKFGLSSPVAIASIVWTLVAFFDVGLGIFPNPIGAIPNFPTVLIGAITITVALREVYK